MAKYQKYAKYKDSGVEWLVEIPSHWDAIRLKHLIVGNLVYGANEAAEDDNPNNPRYIRITDMNNDGSLDPNTFRSLPYHIAENYLLEDGDILLARSGATVGKSFLFKDEFGVSCFAGYLIRARPDCRKLNSQFAYWFFQSDSYWKYISGSQIQSTIQNVSAEKYGDLYLSLPEKLNHQKIIANFLNHETAKIDSLIAKQEKLIELLKEKRQAVISHAVTKGLNPDAAMKDSGVEWIGEVPKHWKVSKLKYESEVVDCRNKTPEYFDDGEYFVVRTTNVKNQELNFNGALYTDKKNFDIWTQRGVPPVGSILFTREAPTGQVCLVPDNLKFCMGQRMMNFISYDSHYGDYLFDYLISDCLDRYINSVSHGSTVTHLRVEQVENIPVLVPGKEEIKEIHLHILKIKQQFNALEQKALETIRLMQERRTALISSAVTGKIDVRNWQKPQQGLAV